MKKIFIITLMFIMIPTLVSAQKLLTIKAEAAPLFNISQTKLDLSTVKSNSFRVGYRAGGSVDINLGKMFYVNGGVNFVQKSSKITITDETALITNLHYIQIPIHAGVKFGISPSLCVAVQAGPYLSSAISGKSHINGLGKAGKIYDIFKNGIDGLSSDFKASRFDFGLSTAGYVHISNFFATVGADFGLINIAKNDAEKSLEAVKDKFENKNLLRNTSFWIGGGVSF